MPTYLPRFDDDNGKKSRPYYPVSVDCPSRKEPFVSTGQAEIINMVWVTWFTNYSPFENYRSAITLVTHLFPPDPTRLWGSHSSQVAKWMTTSGRQLNYAWPGVGIHPSFGGFYFIFSRKLFP